MNYIGDDFSWDKLIIINYSAGYGGDFFCNLLHMNYNPNHTFLPDENNRFKWDDHNVSEAVSKIALKKIITFFRAYNSNDVEKFWDREFEWYTHFIFPHEKLLKKCKDIFAILYDEDPHIFKENYIQFVRNSLYERYNKGYFITNTHYSRPIQNLTIHELLPKSNNFFLTAEKKEHTFLFFLLFCIKENIQKKSIKLIYYKKATNYYEHEQFDNMINIDVGKLFFEDSEYIMKAEDILSNKLNVEIKLNREKIEKYKKDNFNILTKTFDIENTGEIRPKELLEKIMKNYGTN